PHGRGLTPAGPAGRRAAGEQPHLPRARPACPVGGRRTMSALVPNAKAGAVASAPGSEACGCCEGIEAATPQAHANRHGLDAVDYRIGRYDDFRSSLVDGLSSSGFPALSRLLTRDADDFTLGLIDAYACSADVLS